MENVLRLILAAWSQKRKFSKQFLSEVVNTFEAILSFHLPPEKV